MTTAPTDRWDPVRRAALIAGYVAMLVGGALGTVYARQSLLFDSVQMTTSVTDDVVYLPSNTVMRMASLGYGPFASDTVFVRTHAYFLRHMYGDRIFRWLDPYVDAVIALDPNNRDVYNWAATVVRYGQIIDEDVITRSNHFAHQGLERFPDDPRLYEHLGFNKYFEQRPLRMERERELQAKLEASSDPAERERLLSELVTVRTDRYRLEREALLAYSTAAMLPGSNVDPVFLVTLYVKHDEFSAASQAIASIYGSVRPADQEQLLYRLRTLGRDGLAEQLEAAQKQHEDDLSFVPEGLYRLLAAPAELRVPLDWARAESVVEEAMRALEARQQEEEF